MEEHGGGQYIMTAGLVSPMPPSGSVGYAHGDGQDDKVPDPAWPDPDAGPAGSSAWPDPDPWA